MDAYDAMMLNPAHTIYLARARLNLGELLPWALAGTAFFVFPDYLALGSRVLIFIILVVALDLMVGYAGVVTLGHGAFFGIGAYATGIASVSLGITEPIAQLAISMVLAASVGLATGLLIMRATGLTLIMLTLAILAVLHEIANSATGLTGGADGLSGVVVRPLFGAFSFDMFGKVAYLYCLGVLFLVWIFVRRLCLSPFGASLAGMRENRGRMDAIGAPVYWRLVTTYGISAALAGLAGALLTQTSNFVGLNTLSFELSGELLVMLVLGGVGRLYGAFIGPAVFLIAQDSLAKHFPENWYLGIGLLLVFVILFARGGLMGLIDQLPHPWRSR